MAEEQLEQEALDWLTDVGYLHRYGIDIAPDGATGAFQLFANCLGRETQGRHQPETLSAAWA